MSKPTLHIVSEMTGSIGEITRDLIPYFKDAFDLTIERESEPKVFNTLLCHFLNPDVVKDPIFKKFKKKILIQPIDGTYIKEDVIELMNEFDLIITPGEAGKSIMKNNGVIKPIVVIRNFYKDSAVTKPMNLKIKELPTNKILFYHESTCHPRKGMAILYEAFVKAFSDTEYANKVALIVKDSAFNERTFQKNEDIKKEIISLQNQYNNPAQILKISQNLKEETLKRVWNKIDIYVSCAKIEGFGIPLLRMAVMQKPIIALDCPVSGYIDWLNKENSYLIPTKLVTAQDEFMFLYKHNTQWGIPTDIDLVVKAFQTSLEDYLERKAKTVDTKDLEEMHIDKIAEKYIATIKNI